MNPMIVYIGLGSNLSLETKTEALNSIDLIRQATKKFTNIGQVISSSIYQSPPMGPQDQPDYFNAVLKVTLNQPSHPLVILDFCQAIEQQAGRVRKRHWGERTLDVDVLMIWQNDSWLHYHDNRLTVPHVGVKDRSFVVVPLLELEPDFFDGKLYFKTLSTAQDAQLTIALSTKIK